MTHNETVKIIEKMGFTARPDMHNINMYSVVLPTTFIFDFRDLAGLTEKEIQKVILSNSWIREPIIGQIEWDENF